VEKKLPNSENYILSFAVRYFLIFALHQTIQLQQNSVTSPKYQEIAPWVGFHLCYVFSANYPNVLPAVLLVCSWWLNSLDYISWTFTLWLLVSLRELWVKEWKMGGVWNIYSPGSLCGQG
jgi:hypothetical protein